MAASIFPYDTLHRFARQVFASMDCSPAHAHTAATNLLAADLAGVDSHGVARLSGYYRLYKARRMRGDATYAITHQTPGTATFSAGGGLGLVAAELAMQIAIDKAKAVGTGWVAVADSNHFGIAGQYAAMAAKENMIGIAITNASPLVAPTHSKARMLGTNPIAVAIPAGKQPTFLLDMATTTAANGKLEILTRKGSPAPEGWIQTADGLPSTNPNEPAAGGALLPLGGTPQGASHKGYGLGAVVDILSGVLSGANYGPWVPPFVSFLQPLPNLPGKGIGHFFGALRVDAFRPLTEFQQEMDNWIETFRAATPIHVGQPVLIPGDNERISAQSRMQYGIPLLPKVVADLAELAKVCAVPALG